MPPLGRKPIHRIGAIRPVEFMTKK